MSNKILKCVDCNEEFVFTEGEQAFYKKKGFDNEPKRCPDCRKALKAARIFRYDKPHSKYNSGYWWR